MKYPSIVLFLLVTSLSFAQNVNIIPQLKKVEAGQLEEVKKDLIEFQKNNSADPNVIFLQAVITEDGEKAKNFYELIYNNFPISQYADAALFRNFSYFYSLGLYKKAEELKERLRNEYPKTAYLKNTERNFPKVDDMIIVDSTPYRIKSKSKKQFTIQAGAFSNFKNAETLKSKFIIDGLDSKITPKTVNNLLLHIVTVGNFSDRSAADNFLIALQNNYSLKGRVIDRN
jgi:SPOR domain